MATKDKLQALKDPNKVKKLSSKKDAVAEARKYRLQLKLVQQLDDDGPVAHLFDRVMEHLKSGDMSESEIGDTFRETLCQFLQLRKPFLIEYWSKWREMPPASGVYIRSRGQDLDDLLLMFGRLTRSLNSVFVPRVVQLIVDFASARDNCYELSQCEAVRLADELVACWKLVSTEIQLLSPEELQNVSWPERPEHDETSHGIVDADGLDANQATAFSREVALEEYCQRLGGLGLMPPEGAPASTAHPLAGLLESVKQLVDEVERGEPTADGKWNGFDYKRLERLLSTDTMLSYDCYESEDGSEEAMPVGICDEPTDESDYREQIVKGIERYLAAACPLAKEIGSKAYDDLIVCQEKLEKYDGRFYAGFGKSEEIAMSADLKAFIRHLKRARPVLATDCRYKTAAKPVDANVVSVEHSAGKSLRAAMKDPGGRPKKTNGGSKIMTQAEMAEAFGAPCNEEMVANWEARAAGKKRGCNPPDAIYNGEKIVYSAELRLNPTPDNKNRLAALIAEYQSRHRVKEAVDRKNTLHMKSPETLAKASGQIDEALRRKS